MGSELLVACRGARTSMSVAPASKNREVVKSSKGGQSETVRVGVLGASGYTGSEVRVQRISALSVFGFTCIIWQPYSSIIVVMSCKLGSVG